MWVYRTVAWDVARIPQHRVLRRTRQAIYKLCPSTPAELCTIWKVYISVCLLSRRRRRRPPSGITKMFFFFCCCCGGRWTRKGRPGADVFGEIGMGPALLAVDFHTITDRTVLVVIAVRVRGEKRAREREKKKKRFKFYNINFIRRKRTRIAPRIIQTVSVVRVDGEKK